VEEEERGENDAETKDLEYEDEDASVSSISNETDHSDSDDDMPEVQRGPAQVFPEERWRRPVERLRSTLLSCLLPVLLAVLVLYSLYRGVKLFLRSLFDIYIVVKCLVLLAIRIALFPLYLLWLLLIPSFIRSFIWEKFDERIGRRLRRVVAFKRSVEEVICDIPGMLWACMLAGFHACLVPMGTTCQSLCWLICGRTVMERVLDPLHDADVNRVAWSKRRFIEGRGEKQKKAASQAMLAASHLRRAKAQALRAKARRRRQQRRRKELNIELALPVHMKKNLSPDELRVQLQEFDPSKVKSRVMIVERRYAVFVGLAWMLFGLAVLVWTLVGSEDEPCSICTETPQSGFRLCRLGVGQECAFAHHSSEVIASIVLIGVGMVLSIYATCLYRPRSKSAEAIAEEEAKAKKNYQALAARLKKTEDLEAQVQSMLEDHFEKPSCAKQMRECYYASPLGYVQYAVDSCGRAVIRPILRCEQRRRLRQRSIVVQGALTFLAFGWLLALCGLFSRCLHALCRGKAGRRRVSKPEGGASSRPKYRCCPGLRRLLERCYVWRAFLYWTGLGGRSGYGGDDSKVVDAAKRSAGGGARTLEETLAQFGLDTVVAKEQQTFHGALQSLLTDGYEEITQEAGWTGAEIEVQIPERDLELEEEDRDMQPTVEVEDMEMNECEEEVHIS